MNQADPRDLSMGQAGGAAVAGHGHRQCSGRDSMKTAITQTTKTSGPIALKLLLLLTLVMSALVVVPHSASAATAATDDFNRADGSLGPNWTDMNDAGLAISSQQVVGTNSAYSGDIRTGESYASDQFSQIEVTSTQLSGGQWIGATVRAQNGGQNLYLGLYFWNNGNPDMMLFKRIGGGWSQLGSTYASGALAAGTQLTLSATGSSLTFLESGVARITSSDSSLTGGAPGIMAFGTPAADNWSGGDNASSGTTYSVGGTVSGLSGTVVLANNAGDALTVSADGPFTFPTQLATGAAYNVTVQTNPTGQTCTVLDGSGSISSANVSNVSVTCANNASGAATDDFNRADGSLGPNWTDMNDGGLAISSQQVVGTTSGTSGDIRTGESYASDQYSQIEITSTQLSGGQWIGAAVRAQNGGQNTYLGLYFWNNGDPDLMLFKRINGGWTQLGSTYASGALAAGTQLELTVTGSNLTFLENGVARITATDSSLTGGAPGIMAFGTPAADNWSGGDNVSSGLTYSVGGTVSGLTGTVVLDEQCRRRPHRQRRRLLHLPHPARLRSGLQRDGADQPHGADLHGRRRLGFHCLRRRVERLGHLHHQCVGHGHRRLQPGRRQPRAELDRHERRRSCHLVPAGGGHDQRRLGRHPHG